MMVPFPHHQQSNAVGEQVGSGTRQTQAAPPGAHLLVCEFRETTPVTTLLSPHILHL